tara:strand:+ start:30956 stop:31915 length:960 start_codon:yes stop_codon:yes gene_type:complete
LVNASLNWASIVGIVLAVSGAGLYFLRSFKPALARDYDVFFAAIGLLCGGILFFQGWRLDPILQFGQFLLAGTAIFWGYESVRLRGVATDQARRSVYFDDEEFPTNPRSAVGTRRNNDYDRFDQRQEDFQRRFNQPSQNPDDDYEIDPYQRQRVSRPVIPEQAISRRESLMRDNTEKPGFDDPYPRESRLRRRQEKSSESSSSFGDRRVSRNIGKRGTRPSANQRASRSFIESEKREKYDLEKDKNKSIRNPRNVSQKSINTKVEDASFSQAKDNSKNTKFSPRQNNKSNRVLRVTEKGKYNVSSKRKRERDNSSRFDD